MKNSSTCQFFETKIRPVLVEHCYECHAAGAKTVQGGLRVEWLIERFRPGTHWARRTDLGLTDEDGSIIFQTCSNKLFLLLVHS